MNFTDAIFTKILKLPLCMQNNFEKRKQRKLIFNLPITFCNFIEVSAVVTRFTEWKTGMK